jgi:hypothetical protein
MRDGKSSIAASDGGLFCATPEPEVCPIRKGSATPLMIEGALQGKDGFNNVFERLKAWRPSTGLQRRSLAFSGLLSPVASVYSASCDMNGGSDGTRTRGLLRDRQAF